MEIPNFFVIFHHVGLLQFLCLWHGFPYADSRERKKDRTSLSKGNPVFFYINLLTYLKFCRLWR